MTIYDEPKVTAGLKNGGEPLGLESYRICSVELTNRKQATNPESLGKNPKLQKQITPRRQLEALLPTTLERTLEVRIHNSNVKLNRMGTL
jgi:hypothetical protein